jgi:hypothetical protein
MTIHSTGTTAILRFAQDDNQVRSVTRQGLSGGFRNIRGIAVPGKRLALTRSQNPIGQPEKSAVSLHGLTYCCPIRAIQDAE